MRTRVSYLQHLLTTFGIVLLVAMVFTSCTKEDLVEPADGQNISTRNASVQEPVRTNEAARFDMRNDGLNGHGDPISDDGDDETDNERSHTAGGG